MSNFSRIIDNYLEIYEKKSKNLKPKLPITLYYEEKGHNRTLDTTLEKIVQYSSFFIDEILWVIKNMDFFDNSTEIKLIYFRENHYKLIDDKKNQIIYYYDIGAFYTLKSELHKISTIEEAKNFFKPKKKYTIYFIERSEEDENHANIALQIKGKTYYNKSVLFYYEPHGSLPETIKYFQKTFSYLKIFDCGRSFPGGTQGVLAIYDIGFCMTYCYFWISLVLQVLKNTNIEKMSSTNILTLVKKIENYYIEKYKEETLYKMILLFCYEMIFQENFIKLLDENYLFRDKYIKKILSMDLTRNRKTDEEEKIEIKEYNKYLEKLKKEYKKLPIIKTDSYSQEELLKESKKNPELTYEEWEKRRIKEVKKFNLVKKYEDERITLKNLQKINKVGFKINKDCNIKLGNKIGENCKKNYDCFSKKCKKDYDEDGNKSYYCIP